MDEEYSQFDPLYYIRQLQLGIAILSMEQTPVSLQESLACPGLNYVVPMDWWKEYCCYASLPSPKLYDLTHINLRSLVDTLLLDFEEDFVNELSEKSNYLDLTRRSVSPPIWEDSHEGIDYHIVSSKFYEAICMDGLSHLHVMVFGCTDYKADPDEKVEIVNGIQFPRAQRQFQIILCTNKSSFLWIGYIPRNLDLGQALRMIIKEHNKAETPKSKIVFLNIDPERTFPFSSINGRLVKSYSQSQAFLMITNMTDLNEYDKMSDKAQGGDMADQDFVIGSDAQVAQLKTISTGASTPLTFSTGSAIGADNHMIMAEIIHEKSAQQIQQMKALANLAIKDHLIPAINCSGQLQAEQELDLLAEKIIEMASTHRKKIKQK